jgi:hypothetical protein
MINCLIVIVNFDKNQLTMLIFYEISKVDETFEKIVETY